MRLMDKKIILAIAALVVVISAFVAVALVEHYSSAEKVIESETITEEHKRSQLVVTWMIKQYGEGVDLDALDLKFNILGQHPTYGFVIDMATEIIVAHPNEDLIGNGTYALKNSIEPYEHIISTLNDDGKIWVHYDFENPETEEIEPKTSLFQLHEGYIFGSGFYN